MNKLLYNSFKNPTKTFRITIRSNKIPNYSLKKPLNLINLHKMFYITLKIHKLLYNSLEIPIKSIKISKYALKCSINYL